MGEGTSRGGTRAELIATVFLATAALGSAWSAYQSTRWGGVQATQLSRASALRSESMRASDLAVGQTQVDVGVFLSWLTARNTRDREVMLLLEERLHPEFVPAFRDWLGQTGPDEPLPAKTPFASPSYRLAARARSEDLARQAERAFGLGQQANQNGDNYVFCVVLFTTVVFFAGIATKVDRTVLQKILLSMAALLLAVAVVTTALLPPNVGF